MCNVIKISFWLVYTKEENCEPSLSWINKMKVTRLLGTVNIIFSLTSLSPFSIQMLATVNGACRQTNTRYDDPFLTIKHRMIHQKVQHS